MNCPGVVVGRPVVLNLARLFRSVSPQCRSRMRTTNVSTRRRLCNLNSRTAACVRTKYKLSARR